MKTWILTLAMFSAFAVNAAGLAPLTINTLADGREIVAGPEGLTVYVFDIDEGSESKCYDSCAQVWPPVLVDELATVEAPVGMTTRRDGTKQLTVNGRPVYYFANDAAPGDIRGDGLNGVWHILPAAGLP